VRFMKLPSSSFQNGLSCLHGSSSDEVAVSISHFDVLRSNLEVLLRRSSKGSVLIVIVVILMRCGSMDRTAHTFPRAILHYDNEIIYF